VGNGVDNSETDTDGSPPQSARRLSYKFQRLRERIRAAIAAGELAGKLPGERSLARQFNVNAKTLSKALTDLAAEGVLQRNIGLGTFVRDGLTATADAPRILLLAGGDPAVTLADALIRRGLDVQTHEPGLDLPPSLVAPFDLVLVASPDVDDSHVRDLIVRGKSVLTLEGLTRPYSTHALLPHTDLAATAGMLDLFALGHRRMLLIPDGLMDSGASRAVADAVPQAEVRITGVHEAVEVAKSGYTGLVCGRGVVDQVLGACRENGLAVPDNVSVMSYGRVAGKPDCCGHYVTDQQVADAVYDLLVTGLPHKPLTLWLAGKRMQRGTTAPPFAAAR
jgi:hypothetical protein